MSDQNKIEEALSRSVCCGWDRGFLESIMEQRSKGRGLSVKQKETLGKVLARNSTEHQTSHESWEIDYEKQYLQAAIVLATYHSRQPYYKPMAKHILNGGVPERDKFLRMYNNKYSKKVLSECAKDPKYSAGDYVSARASFNAYKNVEMDIDYSTRSLAIGRFIKRGGFIVKIEKAIYSHAKGAKRYTILPVGEIKTFIVEERFLKLGRKRTK